MAVVPDSELSKALYDLIKLRREHTSYEWEIYRKMWKLGYPYYAIQATIKTLRIAPEPQRAKRIIDKVLELGGDDGEMIDAIAPIVLEAAGIEPVNKEIKEVVDGTPVYKAQLEQTWSELDKIAVWVAFDDHLLKYIDARINRDSMPMKMQIEIVKEALRKKYGEKAAAPEEQHPQW